MVYTLISVPLPDSGENGRLVGLIWADPISDSSFSEVEQALRAGRGGGIGKELSRAEDDDEETEEKEGPLCSLRALGQAEKRQDKTRKEKTRQDKTRKEEKRKEKTKLSLHYCDNQDSKLFTCENIQGKLTCACRVLHITSAA